MINILYGTRSGDPYGAQRSLTSLVEGLDRSRFTPFLVCPEAGFLSERAEQLGIPVSILPIYDFLFTANPLGLLRQGWRFRNNIVLLRRHIREQGIQLVHVNSYNIGPPYAIAARMEGVPCIWHSREILLTSPLRKGILVDMIRSLPDRVIAVSEACAAQFGPGEQGDGKIHVVYNGIDSQGFRAQADGQAIRAELGLAPDTPVVGCVGQLIPWKGQDDFLRVAARVHAVLPAARFLVVGQQVENQQGFLATLEELASSLGIREHVIFTGFRQDAPSLIDSINVFLHCAVQPDPLPRVILEAMALSKAIVATDTGGIPEMIEDGRSGFLASPRDVQSLAKATISLLSHAELAGRMGEAARERVEEQFTIIQHVQTVTRLYAELTRQEE